MFSLRLRLQGPYFTIQPSKYRCAGVNFKDFFAAGFFVIAFPFEFVALGFVESYAQPVHAGNGRRLERADTARALGAALGALEERKTPEAASS